MACAGRNMDGLRHAAAAGAWHRVHTRHATEHLPVWPGRTPALAGRPESVLAVGEFASYQLYPRPRKLRISRALYRRLEYRRGALQLRLLDSAAPRFLSMVGGKSRGPRLAYRERTTMVGGRCGDGAALRLGTLDQRGSRPSSSGSVR